jgi:hypothetical protein
MNERIVEFVRQAWLYADKHQTTQEQWFYEYNKKLAELIIQECAKSLWTEECHTSDLALEEFERNSAKIKEHFGVKG